MKNGSGSLNAEAPKGRPSAAGGDVQRIWRAAGAVSLGGGALMAWYGARHAAAVLEAPWFWLAYWILFLILMAAAIYCALIDLRFLRLQAKIAERDLFLDTLGSEEFRQALRDAQARERRDVAEGD